MPRAASPNTTTGARAPGAKTAEPHGNVIPFPLRRPATDLVASVTARISDEVVDEAIDAIARFPVGQLCILAEMALRLARAGVDSQPPEHLVLRAMLALCRHLDERGALA